MTDTLSDQINNIDNQSVRSNIKEFYDQLSDGWSYEVPSEYTKNSEYEPQPVVFKTETNPVTREEKPVVSVIAHYDLKEDGLFASVVAKQKNDTTIGVYGYICQVPDEDNIIDLSEGPSDNTPNKKKLSSAEIEFSDQNLEKISESVLREMRYVTDLVDNSEENICDIVDGLFD